MSPSTILIHRDVFSEFSGFRIDYPVCEDYDLWLKMTAKYSVSYVEDFCIKKYGGHEDQLSTQYKAMDYWRILSLDSIFSSPHLEEEERSYVRQSILKRGRILLNGYRKHDNLKDYLQIEILLKKYE